MDKKITVIGAGNVGATAAQPKLLRLKNMMPTLRAPMIMAFRLIPISSSLRPAFRESRE